jgi:hypothetical protein
MPDVAVIKAVAPTSTGTQEIDTGLGDQISALYIAAAGPGDVEDVVVPGRWGSRGLCDAALAQHVVSWAFPYDEDEVDSGEGTKADDYVIHVIGDTDPSVDQTTATVARATVTALNADGTFELDWDTVSGDAFPFVIVAFSDLANAELHSVTLPVSTGSPVAEEIGFDPTLAIFLHERESGSITGYSEWNDSWFVRDPSGSAPTYAAALQAVWDDSGVQSASTMASGPLSVQLTIGGFPDDYDRWSVELRDNGLDIDKTLDDGGTSPTVVYLALDSLDCDVVDDIGPIEVGRAYQLSRVAAAVMVCVNDGEVQASSTPGETANFAHESVGAVDRFGEQHAVGGGSKMYPYINSGWDDIDDGAFSESWYHLDRLQMVTRPRVTAHDGAGSYGIEGTYTTGTVDWDDPGDPNVSAAILETRLADGTLTNTFDPPAAVVAIGTYALPLVVTAEPSIHWSPDCQTLWVTFKADVNPNQREAEVTFEWGATIAYGNTSGPHPITNPGGGTQGHRWPVWRPAWKNLGDPVGDVPDTPYQHLGYTPPAYWSVINPSPESVVWTPTNTYHYRAVIETDNGIAYGDDVEFTITECPAFLPVIYRYEVGV